MGALSDDPCAEVALVARLLARAGLVEGFGHVSVRGPEGALLITSTAPLARQTASEVDGPDASGRPLETPLHAAIYAARPDVGAICRTHSRWAVAWGARGQIPPAVHGLGLLSGEVALQDEVALVTDPESAARAARALGAADCLLPRGNGCVTTGPDLATAAVRAWFLEERARVAADAAPAIRAISDRDASRRSRHLPQETARAWRWLADVLGADDNEGGRA